MKHTLRRFLPLLLGLVVWLSACGSGDPADQGRGQWDRSTWDAAAWQ